MSFHILAISAFLCGQASAATLQVAVRPVFNGEPLILDSLRYETSAKEKFSVTRLSFILSGFAVEKADGGWVEVPDQLAWLDAATRRTSFTMTNIPAGNYRSVRFNIGPDAKQNSADVTKFPADHPLNPNLNGLHWTWQTGFIFLAAEGLYRSQGAATFLSPHSKTNGDKNVPAPWTDGDLRGWSYHLARDPNRTAINLNAQLDLSSDARVELDLDVATLLNAPRPISFARDGSATHSREGDPIAASLAANLPGAFRVRKILSASASTVARPVVKPLYLPAKYTPFPFTMPATFPIPEFPRDNPLLVERVTLGEKLFNETALSRDSTISCASCHSPAFAFSDPRRFSKGVDARQGIRNAQQLANLAWKSSFFWDGRAPTLRAQALVPIEDHLEMDDTVTNVCVKLATLPAKVPTMPDYPALFAAAFGAPEITPEKLGLALEAFMLTLTSFDSKLDRAIRGEAELTTDEKRGFELFMTEYEPRTGQMGADCFHCHGGPLFADNQFHNNGLDADVAETFLSPTPGTGMSPLRYRDIGRAKVTGRDADRGKFATPSLRNVSLTAPYMHDGRFGTLEEVVNHYRRGVKRSATLDPNLAKHPDGGVPLTDDDVRALVAFLKSLTSPKSGP